MANQVAGRFRLVAASGQPPEAGQPPYPPTPAAKPTAFERGYAAYGEGREQEENPYFRIDPRHNEWSSGWAQHNFDLAN